MASTYVEMMDNVVNSERQSTNASSNNANETKYFRIGTLLCISIILILALIICIFTIMTYNEVMENNDSDTSTNASSNASSNEDTDTADWVIVGAGAGGLYMANALLQHNASLKMKIIEQLDRVGGRLFSLSLEYAPTGATIDLEMGGMRFSDSQQKLNKLLTWMGICYKKELFTHGTRSDNNPYFLRRYRFTVGESLNESSYWRQAYNIKDSEDCTIQKWEGGWPMCYYIRVFNLLKTQNDPNGTDPKTASDWQFIRNHWNYNDDDNNKYTLNAISFSVLLRKMGFSREAMKLMAGSSGFVTSFFQSEVNAGDALQLYVAEYFDPETTLSGGYENIAIALYDNLIRSYSDQLSLETGHNVTSINQYGNFYKIVSYDYKTQSTQTHYTRNIAITMDSGQLQRQLPGFTPINTPYVRSLVYGATEQRLSKINLIFDEDLGKFENVSYNGGSFTDAEIASLYMVGSWRNDTDGVSFYAAVIYCDYYNSDFWWSLYDPDDPYPFNSSVLNAQNGDLSTQWNASNAQVEMALDILNEMFNLSFPKPLAGFYSPWGTGTRYGGSTNFYTVGVNDEVLQEQIWQPLSNQSIYICNEAYSDDHGWVEGTLQSCNKILEGLGVPIPYNSSEACPPINTSTVCPNGFSSDRWTCNP